jgi:TIR domain/APAF-1 helical domain
MPDEPPRLFLSYGVHDASELAERLRRDLTARGYQVWQDVNRIRAGRPWDEEVQTGLRNSQVLLALLSPQSVRRARDAGNPTATDSVCLDEIEYAQRACKIPIVPVLQNASLYCLKHLLAHLHEADQNDQARTVLLDFDWLQAKLTATDTNALITARRRRRLTLDSICHPTFSACPESRQPAVGGATDRAIAWQCLTQYTSLA